MVRDTSELLVRFGKRVRELRRASGASQEAFADQCGLDRTYISSIERGQRNVSLENLKVLSKALNVTLSRLLAGL